MYFIAMNECDDLRREDLSQRDMSAVPLSVLLTCTFDTQNRWPDKSKLPAGFDPRKLIEESKNPGLGIQELHQRGIDGHGVKVAIIDQKLLIEHQEYKDQLVDYKEVGSSAGETPSMHGAAVASLLVGKTCGVAPKAKLYYRAAPSGREFRGKSAALRDLIELNKSFPAEEKIRIVSCSVGHDEHDLHLGSAEWAKALEEARESGLIVFDSNELLDHGFVGGGSPNDKSNPDNYQKWLCHKNRTDVDYSEKMIVPSDYRAMASYKGASDYMYNGKGGLSWSIPTLAGVAALALQVNPELTGKEIISMVKEGATRNQSGLNVMNPVKTIDLAAPSNQPPSLW